MFSEEEKEGLIGFILMFLSTEGKISDADFALIEKLENTFGGFPENSELKETIEEAESKIFNNDNNDIDIRIHGIAIDKTKTRFEKIALMFSMLTESEPKINRAILWSMVWLQHWSTEKTNNRQKLIDLWVLKPGNSMSILLEMQEICKTQSEIINYQKSLEENKTMSYSEVKSMLQELDKDLDRLQEKVKNLIFHA
jgi:hypothetical protein